MREPAYERIGDTALAEARDQLEQRTRRARGLRAQELVAQIGEPFGLPGADLVVEIAEVEAAGANALDQRIEVGAARTEIGHEIGERGSTAEQREHSQVRRFEREQQKSRATHPAEDDDAFQKRANPAPEARRQRVEDQRARGLRYGVLDHLAIGARRDRGVEPGRREQRAKARDRERGVHHVRARDTEAADQPRRDPELERELDEVREREEGANEHRE